MCNPLFEASDDGEDEDEDDDDEETASTKANDKHGGPVKRRCDGGESCLCTKPATELPDHTWVVTRAARQKYFIMRTLYDLRCPDLFNMYTFNDHTGLGVMEVMENLVMDFAESKGNWQKQWVLCEAMKQFGMSSAFDPIMLVGDGKAVNAPFELLARMFLTMLATLKEQNLLQRDSEIKDLGNVTDNWIQLARDWGLESDWGLGDGNTAEFGSVVKAYAKPHGITLRLMEALEDFDGVPEDEDPFKFAASLKDYERKHSKSLGSSKKARIGGDAFDITTWSSSERKESSFDGEDPLGKTEIEALKNGMVMQLA